MLNLSDLVIVRPYKDEDLPFIYDSWSRSYAEGVWVGPDNKPTRSYNRIFRPVIERLVSKDSVTILVVELKEQIKHRIIGWVCSDSYKEELLIHFVYVKSDYRSLGMAHLLLASVGGYCPGCETIYYSFSNNRAQSFIGHYPKAKFISFTDL